MNPPSDASPVEFAQRSAVMQTMTQRRSHPVLDPPAPSSEDLRRLITAANVAPDHGRLVPWRFLELRPEAYDEFGAVLADALTQRCRAAGTEPSGSQLDKERTKLRRAPLVVITAAVHQESDKIPRIEQFAAAVAATQNFILAATADGWGTMWRTGPAAYDSNVKSALSLKSDDAIVGFIYIGTPTKDRSFRERQPAPDVLSTWPAAPMARGS